MVPDTNESAPADQASSTSRPGLILRAFDAGSAFCAGTLRWSMIAGRQLGRTLAWFARNAVPVSATAAGLFILFDRATDGHQRDFQMPNDSYEIAMSAALVLLFIGSVIPAWVHRRNREAEVQLDALAELARAMVGDRISATPSGGEAYVPDWRASGDAYAQMLSRQLKLDGDDRVSVYLLPKSRNALLLAGRFSENRALREAGRSEIPLRGIAKKAIETPIPHRDIVLWDPMIRRERYRKVMLRHGTMHQATLEEGLSMLSRNYMVIPVLQCEAGVRGTSRPIGIVVFESNHPFRFIRKERYLRLVRSRHDLLEMLLERQAPLVDTADRIENFVLPMSDIDSVVPPGHDVGIGKLAESEALDGSEKLADAGAADPFRNGGQIAAREHAAQNGKQDMTSTAGEREEAK